MARGARRKCKLTSACFRATPYPPQFLCRKVVHEKILHDKKDWEDALCSVCMEFPHNAVLLLCSSHDKGCRPYMCATSYRYSNCLNQFMKACTQMDSATDAQDSILHLTSQDPPVVADGAWPCANYEAAALTCPLCRGQVKGWTVVEDAREFLNQKKRSCMQDGCTFMGNYKELRKHMRAVHPLAQPRKVDPAVEQKWKRLEWERERQDVISTVTASNPGAMIVGDYLIEGGPRYGSDDDLGNEIDSSLYNIFCLLHAGANGGFSSRLRRLEHLNSLQWETGARFVASETEDEGLSVATSMRGVGRAERRRRQRRRRRAGLGV